MHDEIEVEIEAPAEAVWEVLADVERWPEWTASMRSVRRLDGGALHVGSEALVEQPRLRDLTYRVTRLEPASDFTWESRSPGLRVEAGHAITPLGERRSRVKLTVEQSGLMGVLVRPLTAGITRRYLAMETAGLKRRCEEG